MQTSEMMQSSLLWALVLVPASPAQAGVCCTAGGNFAGNGRASSAIGGLQGTTARGKLRSGSGQLPWLWLLGAWLWLTAVPAFGQTLLFTLDAPTPQAGASFGNSLVGIGDVNGDRVPDLAVGAPYQVADGNPNQGRVFVFSGADGALLLSLDNPIPQAGARFGTAVAGVGDVNGDGVPDVAVGAPLQGQVFIFSGANGALLLTLPILDVIDGDGFGTAVAGMGDINGDGVPDVAVGVHNQFVSGIPFGQVFVFSGANGALLLALDDPSPGELFNRFGSVMRAMADVNGDGVRDLVVGAPGDVGPSDNQGRVFVFSGADGALLRPLDHPTPHEEAQFGATIAEVGDVNGDKVPDLAVGAPFGGGGQVFIFSGADGALLLSLDNPNLSVGSIFGISLAEAGDINDDGVLELAVGDPSNDAGGNHNQGRVFVFSGADGALLLTLDNPIPQAEAFFGFTLAAVGDINGDGMPDLAIGAPWSGQVFVFSVSVQSQPAPPSPPTPLPSPAPEPSPSPPLAPSTGGDGDGGGCFIATAAYGSHLHPHVAVLRNFRDRYLLTHAVGRDFVRFYYQVSPPIADFISNHACFKRGVLWALTPVVYGVRYPSYTLLTFLSFLTVAIVWWEKRHASISRIPPLPHQTVCGHLHARTLNQKRG